MENSAIPKDAWVEPAPQNTFSPHGMYKLTKLALVVNNNLVTPTYKV
ncbi:hypothetical protein HYV31_01415 [candidate division WWE3 bacterium]|nr:hypothetical protein [candidate division WWE3 bacterium]